MTGLEDAIARANLDIYLNRSKWGIVSFPGKDGYAAPFLVAWCEDHDRLEWQPSNLTICGGGCLARKGVTGVWGNKAADWAGQFRIPGAAEHILNLMPELESISGIELAGDCRWASRRCGVDH